MMCGMRAAADITGKAETVGFYAVLVDLLSICSDDEAVDLFT